MYRLEITADHPSLNAWLAGASHWKRSKRKQEEEEALLWHLRSSDISKPLGTPFTLSVTVFRTRPYDTDNAIISAKYFLDALRAGGYIPDDSINECPTIIMHSKKIELVKGKRHDNKIVYLIEPCDSSSSP
mgnify:CR=1 FL=1